MLDLKLMFIEEGLSSHELEQILGAGPTCPKLMSCTNFSGTCPKISYCGTFVSEDGGIVGDSDIGIGIINPYRR